MHTHKSDESTTGAIKTETTPSNPLLAMAHRSINTSDDAPSDITNVLSVKRSSQIQVCQCYPFHHANHTNQQLVDHGANGGLAGSDMSGIHRTYHKIKIQDIENHEVTGLDVVMTEFCQPLQVQSHLEMPMILVQLGDIQCT